jgi:diguanylate cyclase (GGDEF)-like protein/PAS domain S-box-containing protein
MTDAAATARTILIVDDEVHNRKLLEALLRPEGYVTVTAGSGSEALTAVALHQPDLILLDLMMPGMDGYEVTRALKGDSSTSNIPIIMVTAQTDRTTLLDALDAGVEEFLTKPVNRAELWLRVRNLLRLKDLRDLLDGQNASLECEVLARTAELQRFRTAMDETGDAIFLVAGDGQRFIEVNTTATRMFGYSRQEFLGLGLAPLPATTQIELERLRDAIVGGPAGEKLTEARIRRKDGLHLPVEIHRRSQPSVEDSITVGVVRDITEREEAHLRLYQMAHQDALTGLPNRTMFFESLAKTLSQAKKNNWGVAILYADLDHFKTVNDTHGHAMGDTLLIEVGERLVQCVRHRDTVGRLGGDEFAVILILNERHEGAEVVVRNIRKKLSAPFALGNYEVSLTASIGVTHYPENATDPELLIAYADTAMYRAKQAGRDTHCVFTPQMNVELLMQLSMEAALRKAIESDQFVVYYQPKVDLETGRISGLEALLRWQRPGHGLVEPNYFIPILEETGMIIEVGSWVIATVCNQIREWSYARLGDMQVSVNVSGRQFINHDLDGDVAVALSASGIDAALFELELTESSLMQNTESTIATLLALKARGVELSIDDFGTGYSSLAYLQRFPIDKVKIDIAFVRSITGALDAVTIAQTIIQMAHSLNMKAIAEGVETAEQHAYLRHHGCDEFQGYFFSRPLPPEEVGVLLRGDALLFGQGQGTELAALSSVGASSEEPASNGVATVRRVRDEETVARAPAARRMHEASAKIPRASVSPTSWRV